MVIVFVIAKVGSSILLRSLKYHRLSLPHSPINRRDTLRHRAAAHPSTTSLKNPSNIPTSPQGRLYSRPTSASPSIASINA